MSKETVGKVLGKALSDKSFRGRLSASPDDALRSYEGELSANEIAALRGLTPELLDGFTSVAEQAAARRAWWQPGSFKELGGAALSVILVVLLIVAAGLTYRAIGATPVVYTVNGGQQSINPFDQAKDLLVILFPMFSAVVTFWLGVAVEGRRAEESKEAADREKAARETAEKDKQSIAADAAEALGKVEGWAMTLPRTVPMADPGPHAGAPALDPRDEILRIVRDGQRTLRR